MKSILVWDIPVRLFHWSLATSILFLFITAQIGGNAMEWHKKIGFFVIGLIAFNVSVHIPPPEQRIDEDDTGPVSVSETVKKGHGHG